MEYRNSKRVGQFLIDCEIMLRGNWLPFTANLNDVEPLGRDIFAAADLILPPWVDETASEQLGAVEVGPDNEGQANETS